MKANYVHKDSTTLVQDKFIKNGVFSLEYDKETLRDMVLELQEENARLKENNMSMQEEMSRAWGKADLYKEVIEEVKDRITIKIGRYINEKDYVIDDVALDELLQILDKILDILKKEDN